MKMIECNFFEHGHTIMEIFNHEIANTTALFEYHPRDINVIKEWFDVKIKHAFPIIGVVNDQDQLMGFASYGTFRAWSACKYTVEHSIYIHKKFRGKGLASLLMSELITLAQKNQMHVMIGAIASENSASIALHKKFGFIHSGTIKQAGFKFGQWRDFDFYQKIFSTPTSPVEN